MILIEIEKKMSFFLFLLNEGFVRYENIYLFDMMKNNTLQIF